MTVRCFTAVVLPEEMRDAIAETMRMLDATFRMLGIRAPRWEKRENLHCTLNFFGAVETTVIERFLRAASGQIEPSRFPITCTIGGLGTFPDGGKRGVLWIGVEDDSSRSVGTIRAALKLTAAECGITMDDAREFHPHITIGRWKQPVRLDEEQERALARMNVRLGAISIPWITLMRSVTHEEGAEYSELARI